MKTNILRLLILSFLIICTELNNVFPQSNQKGTLTGRVTAADTKEGLPFANVVIDGTNNGIATDIEGYFFLRNIAAGKQKIKITYVGYVEKIQEVAIIPGKEVKINISLQPHSIEANAVVVTAQAKGQLSAINQQINSNTIKDVVSPERLQENPDANAAEALGRLPGLSLIRSGGEGVGIVIRGMGSSYSSVTLNGVELPATDSWSRSTSISGISQFLLQTVEVIKAKTPDMDGNSVAGTINLKLGEAADSLCFNILAEGGYNNMNDFWGNYRLASTISDRILNKKLGIRFDVNLERINRSTQTMSAGYNVISNIGAGLQNEQVLLGNVYLNDINRIPKKQSATLVLDYPVSSNTKVVFYNFFTHSDGEQTDVTKYTGLDRPYYNANVNQYNSTNLMYQSSLNIEHNFSWADIDYGYAFSQTHNYTPQNRYWDFLWRGGDYNVATSEEKMLSPQEILKKYHDNSSDSVMTNMVLQNIGFTSDDMIQKNQTSYLNVKVPFMLNSLISGYIKVGGKYNYINRDRTYLSANQAPPGFSEFGNQADEDINWVRLNSGKMVNAVGLVDHNIGGFLNDQFTFGWYPRLDRLNQIWDWWNNLSNNYFALGSRAVINKFGAVTNCGFVPDILNSSLNNQSLKESYIGTYLMSELDYSTLITTSFGARYEKVTDNLYGFNVNANSSVYGLSIPGKAVSATHNDEYWLPMVHLQLKPVEGIKLHLSYAKALSRPDFGALMPNTYYSHVYTPYYYSSGNPYLKPELWSNYDLQLVAYSNEIGLFSVNGFYKEVKDKIWQRSYERIPGDPVIPGFTSAENVNVTEWVNHKDPGNVKGIEFEWQTNFWYLPSPFNYFSLNFNYTLLKSEQQYPTTRVWTTYEYVNGRPKGVLHRVDSTITDQMLNQPNNIANISLGFNYKGFNIWLSYQYNGKTLTGWTSQRELIPYKQKFERWDLQATQKLPIKGMSVLFNIANISNYTESSQLMGDVRPTYLESYGWTSDLGLRYEL